jgi:hypothetical protein
MVPQHLRALQLVCRCNEVGDLFTGALTRGRMAGDCHGDVAVLTGTNFNLCYLMSIIKT